MKVPDRELVILLPQGEDPDGMSERQTAWLHTLLNKVETIEHYVEAVELLNLHRGGITQNPVRIELAFRRKKLGPFQFLLHKN